MEKMNGMSLETKMQIDANCNLIINITFSKLNAQKWNCASWPWVGKQLVARGLTTDYGTPMLDSVAWWRVALRKWVQKTQAKIATKYSKILISVREFKGRWTKFSEIHWNSPPLNCAALCSPPAVAHGARAAKNSSLLRNTVRRNS